MKRIFLLLLIATVARGATYDYPVKTATNALSASKALTTDANGKAAASATTSTEIGYVSGVTSAIQSQLNAKLAATNGNASGGTFTGSTNASPFFSSAATSAFGVAGQKTGTDALGGLWLGGGYGSPVLGRIYIGDGSGWRVDLATRSNSVDSVKATFKDDGTFAFGATNVIASTTLNVVGGTIPRLDLATDISATRQVLILSSPAATQTYGRIQAYNYNTGGAANLVINNTVGAGTGYVGIQTTTPQYLLDISGQARILGTNGIRFSGTSGATDDTVSINQPSANVLALNATTSYVSGNLGIGTNAPSYSLDILRSDASSFRALSSAALGATSGSGLLGGSTANPSATGQRLGFLVFSGNTSQNSASVSGWSSESWSGAGKGSYVTIETTTAGASSRTEKARISDTGLTLTGGATIGLTLTISTLTKTTNYTITATDPGTIFADATGGAVTITLPAASSSTLGRRYEVFKVDSSGNAVNIAPNGSDTLLAGSTTNTTAQANCLRVTGYTSTSWIVNKTQ